MKLRLRLYWSSGSLAVALLAAPSAAAFVEPLAVARAVELQDVLLSVSINGAPAGEPVALIRGAGETFYVPSEVLESWRLKPDLGTGFTRNGTRYHLLNAISGLRLELDEPSQILNITAPPEVLEMTRLPYTQVEPTEEVMAGTGGFVNYDATAQLAGGETSLGGAIEAGIFSSLGVMLTGFVSHLSDKGLVLTRLGTNWTVDDPVNMRSLRFGDGISRGGVGGPPLHFGGIQFARNFSVQPGFVTIPQPSVQGSAAVPSIVDIYINDLMTDSRGVPPGPFEITDLPIITGGGNVQLVVRDLLGRQALYSQSYYAAPQLLRKGLHDFSYEAGFLRRDYGRQSSDYGALMVSATHRYGFTDRFTGEVHAVGTRHVQSAGVAASLALWDIGHVEGSMAASRSALGDGAMAGFSVERRSRGLSLGVHTEFTTSDYMLVGWGKDRRPAASTIQAFAGVPLQFGSIGISYLRRKGRSEPDAEYFSTSASLRLGGIGSLHLTGRRSLRGDEDLGAEVFLAIPIGRRTSAGTGASVRDGSVMLTAEQQRNLPVGNGFGYRVAASTGTIDRLEGRVSLQTGFGAYEAHLASTDGRAGIRLSAAGGFGIAGGHTFASRQLNQSFATVKVGDYADVRVYADNQLVGRTNRSGMAVVPRLRPFGRNVIRIDVADLPLDAEVSGEERMVRPYDRHGVMVNFAAKPARAAIIRVLFEDGTPLPAAASVRLKDSGTEFFSAPGGEVYLTGLESENTALVSWSKGTCQIKVRYAETSDPQPAGGFSMPTNTSMKWFRFAAALALGLVVSVGAAPAAAATCSVNGQGVSFGNYDPLSTSALDGVGNINVTCDAHVPLTVSLSSGSSGTYTERRMTSGFVYLRYNLYMDAARSIVWGDGVGSSNVSATAKNVDLPVYGRIPALQNVPANAYADTITVTLTF